MSQREQDYITLVRQAARGLWDNLNALRTLKREFDAMSYGTALDVGVGVNEGISSEMIGAVVFDTADALNAVVDGGHAANLAKLL